jgi:hypothetical protein
MYEGLPPLRSLQPFAHHDVHTGKKEDAATSAVLQARSFTDPLPSPLDNERLSVRAKSPLDHVPNLR